MVTLRLSRFRHAFSISARDDARRESFVADQSPRAHDLSCEREGGPQRFLFALTTALPVEILQGARLPVTDRVTRRAQREPVGGTVFESCFIRLFILSAGSRLPIIRARTRKLDDS